VKHLLPEAYHGNPVSADGSLVFTDFGWDILEQMNVAGFSDVSVDVYVSAEFGHFGGGQLVFNASKFIHVQIHRYSQSSQVASQRNLSFQHLRVECLLWLFPLHIHSRDIHCQQGYAL
jgi:hypothetical protein